MTLLPALMVPFPKIPFTSEEAIGVINEVVIGTNKVAKNLFSCFSISCFTISVAPSIKGTLMQM